MKTKIRDGQWSLRERTSLCYRAASLRKMSSKELWTLDGPAPSFKAPGAGGTSGKPGEQA
jgi:hypothetical protein